jgi:hypothetical protein
MKEAKSLNYNSTIPKSSDKNKTVWNIIKLETGKKSTNEDTHVLNIEENINSKHQVIADALINFKYFLRNITLNSLSIK